MQKYFKSEVPCGLKILGVLPNIKKVVTESHFGTICQNLTICHTFFEIDGWSLKMIPLVNSYKKNLPQLLG